VLSEGSRNSKLFAVDGEAYGWDDVVALAELRGEWGELRDRVRRGLAAIAELEAQGEPVSDEELEEAARRFRYDRDLLAADELTAWLERHRLSMEDWFGYLRRQLAGERGPDTGRDLREDAVEAAVWAEGICSGRLERLEQELARLAAVSPETPLERLDTAFADFCATVDEEAEAREVEANRLEWLRFTYEALVAEHEGAALEAALCVRADGESVQAVAQRARLELEADECWLDELEPALATRFLAAAPGDLVGPVPVDGGFVVAHVLAKTEPSLEDAGVRARAREAAIERAVSRLVADRVVRL
jgi:hypothetical protein